MRHLIPLFIAIFGFLLNANAQDTSTISGNSSVAIKDTTKLKNRCYKAIVTMETGSPAKGYLIAVSDSSVYLSKQALLLRSSVPSIKSQKIDYNYISKVNLKRQGSIGRGALTGGIAGLVAGAVLGLATYEAAGDEFNAALNYLTGYSKGTSTLTGALIGGVTGTVVGVIAGALLHKSFVIKGQKEKLREMRATLLP
jgi:hypothetical protein